jgi:NhaP-type Na+/H+ and K+/H+ antiporter
MAKDPAFLFYSNDFLSGTFTMSDEQVGKYIRLLCLQHQKYELSEKDMLNICKSYDEDIYCKFTVIAGKYFNERLRNEAERRKAYSLSRKENRENGKKGLKIKKVQKNGKSVSLSYDNHMETETITETITKDKDKRAGKKILFSETEYYNDFPKFKEKFLTEKYKQYDAEHYFEAVKNWSDGKGEKRIDWIAVARSFVKNDGDNPRISKNGNVEMIKLPD